MLTCVAIICVGRRILGWGPALWAAVIFTVAPLTLANTRWGYSYAQLTFLGLLVLYAAWRYFETPTLQWLVTASALAGLAAFSDYVGIAWVLFVALLALRHSWRLGAPAAGVGAGVLLIGLLVCFLAAPSTFLTEITSTGRPRRWRQSPYSVRRTAGELLSPSQLRSLDRAWHRRPGTHPSFASVWLPARRNSDPCACRAQGARRRPKLSHRHAAATLAGPRRRRRTLLCLRALEPLGTHLVYLDCHSPFPSGEGGRGLGRTTLAALVVFLAVISPLAIATASDASGLATTLPTRQDAYLATPTGAKAVAAYVLAHSQPGDLVLASPEIAWMFDSPNDATGHQRILHSADILQVLAQSGHAAAFYPANLPQSGWAYRVSLDSALRDRRQPMAHARRSRPGAYAHSLARTGPAVARRLRAGAIHNLRAARFLRYPRDTIET